MADVMGIAVSGMNDAVARVANAAQNIANVQSKTESGDKYTPTQVVTTTKDVGDVQLGVTSEVVQEPQGTEVDLAKEIVQVAAAEISYGANAEVVKTANDMQRKLLDVLA